MRYNLRLWCPSQLQVLGLHHEIECVLTKSRKSPRSHPSHATKLNTQWQLFIWIHLHLSWLLVNWRSPNANRKKKNSTEDRFENDFYFNTFTILPWPLYSLLIYRKCSNVFLYSEVIRIFLVMMFHYLRSQVFRGGVNTMHMINAFITHVHLHMYEMSQLNSYCK